MIGYGPQLAELESRDRLVGRDETPQTFRVQPPVAVRDGLEGDVVDAWERRAAPGSLCSFRGSGALPWRRRAGGMRYRIDIANRLQDTRSEQNRIQRCAPINLQREVEVALVLFRSELAGEEGQKQRQA
jgi:hypothetical protein